MRPRSLPILSGLAVLLAGLLPAARPAPPTAPSRTPPCTPSSSSDASEGWAVGDEGVVWHTIDGGKQLGAAAHRRPRLAALAALPQSLHRLGRRPRGAARRRQRRRAALHRRRRPEVAARAAQRPARPERGPLRRRQDRLPRRRRHRPVSQPASSPPTDGGRTWQPVPGPRCPSWLAGRLHRRRRAPSWPGPGTAWPRSAAARVFAGRHGLAGRPQPARRAVARRRRRGRRPGRPGAASATAGRLELGLRRLEPAARTLQADWDFHAVHGAGRHVWVVGRPGSVVLHSADGGTDLGVSRPASRCRSTASSSPTRRHGWAVGELGTILATTDGGKTWQLQHRGGQRAAAAVRPRPRRRRAAGHRGPARRPGGLPDRRRCA